MTCTSTAAGGNWNAGGTWVAGCGAGGPVAGDTVFIATTGANLVTVNVATAAMASVTVDANATLTVAQTLNINSTAASFLTVNGTLNIGNNATARTINVTGPIAVAGTMSVPVGSNAAHILNTGGDITNTGAIDFAPDAGSLCNVTFNRNGNQTVSGAGATTRFNRITLNMGATRANILDYTATNLTFGATTTSGITITNGTFRLSSAVTIAPFGA